MSIPFRRSALAAPCLALVLLSAPALAIDGAAPGGGEGGGGECTECATAGGASYYEGLAQDGSLADLESSDAGLPAQLQIDGSTARVRYLRTGTASGRAQWEVRLTDFVRNHERVDAVYHVLLVLPLPPGARALERGVALREGAEAASVPLVYDGELLTLKRDVGLEKALLPGLVGETEGKLPSLQGTGYDYTLWGTVVRYDALRAATLQGWASLRYETAEGVAAPDAADPRFSAYVVTWVPALRADVRPWAIRVDVAP